MATAILGETVVNTVVSGVKSVARTIRKAAQPIVDTVSTAWNKATQMYREAQEEISRLDKTAPDYHLQVDAIYRSACARYMGVEEKTSAAKRDEKEQQIYELEQKLSDADRAAGIRVVELDGQLYYDYTAVINRRLDEALVEFQEHSLLSGDVDTLLIRYAQLKDIGNLFWFAQQVGINCPWDIKRENSWKKQFGDEITIPKYYGYIDKDDPGFIPDQEFIYEDIVVTRESLGNITYGYLGSSMNIPPDFLYMAGGLVEIVSNNDHLGQVWEFITNFGGSYGEPMLDHAMTQIGIELYNQHHQ